MIKKLIQRYKGYHRWKKAFTTKKIGLIQRAMLCSKIFIPETAPDLTIDVLSKYTINTSVLSLKCLLYATDIIEDDLTKTGYARGLSNIFWLTEGEKPKDCRLSLWTYIPSSDVYGIYGAWESYIKIGKLIYLLHEKSEKMSQETYFERKCFYLLEGYIELTRVIGEIKYGKKI